MLLNDFLKEHRKGIFEMSRVIAAPNMNRVYSISNDQATSAFAPVRCKSEEVELQTLLEKNLDLIPGDQIDPENPRRWLLVKREMTVEDKIRS